MHKENLVPYADIITKRIACFCNKRDISYNKLSVMSGVPQSTLDNIMRGETVDLRLSTIHKISNGLGMTVSELLDFDEFNNYVFPED